MKWLPPRQEKNTFRFIKRAFPPEKGSPHNGLYREAPIVSKTLLSGTKYEKNIIIFISVVVFAINRSQTDPCRFWKERLKPGLLLTWFFGPICNQPTVIAIVAVLLCRKTYRIIPVQHSAFPSVFIKGCEMNISVRATISIWEGCTRSNG